MPNNITLSWWKKSRLGHELKTLDNKYGKKLEFYNIFIKL